jgi:hypothetical protein
MNPKETGRVGTPEAEAVSGARSAVFLPDRLRQSLDRRGTKAKLVSYSKQVLPKFIDEQPNASNSPLLSTLIKDETRTLPVDVARAVSPGRVSGARASLKKKPDFGVRSLKSSRNQGSCRAPRLRRLKGRPWWRGDPCGASEGPSNRCSR